MATRGLPLLGLILLAWALRLYRLDAQSFWYDEGYSIFMAALPPAEMVRWTAGDFTPPLYDSLLHLWLPLAGWSEFAARFLSVCAGTLTIAALVRLGRNLHSRLGGGLAGLLAAAAPFAVWHSQDARTYTLQGLFGLLATLCLLRALRHPQRRPLWAAFALCDALMLYAHATGGFLLVFHALAILAAGLFGCRWRRWLPGGLALAGAALAWLPWLLYAVPFLGQNAGYWPGTLDWRTVVGGAFHGFVTGRMMSGVLELTALVAWGAVCALGLLAPLCEVRSPQSAERATHHVTRTTPHVSRFTLHVSRFTLHASRFTLPAFLLAYFAIPTLTLAVLFHNVAKFSPQYLIVASPPVFLLPAVGLAALLSRPGLQRALGALTLVALLTTAGLGLRNLYFDSRFARPDFRLAAQTVREQMTPDEVVVLVPGHTFPVWEYYFGPDGWLPLPDDPVLNVHHVLTYHDTARRLSEWLSGHSGVWLVEWDPRVADPTDLVPYLLGEVGQEVTIGVQPGGLRLRHYRLLADRLPLPEEPPVTAPLESSFDLPLRLAGCALPESWPGDAELRVACYWQSGGPLPLHVSVSARLMDTAGAEWGRGDTAISGPDLVAERWPSGEWVLGQYTLQPEAGIPPGDFYRLELQVYEPDGPFHGAATVGPLTVARPTRPFRVTLPAGPAAPARLGGLRLEAAAVSPPQVLPGDAVWVDAVWQVLGPFDEPRLAVAGAEETASLLPQPGASAPWQVGDRYRTRSRVPISPYAPGGPTSLLAVSGDGTIPLGQVQIDITRTFALPTDIEPLACRLGESLLLVGTRFSLERDAAGVTAQVVLYWQAHALVAQPYTVFVHLVGPDGQLHDQADGPPQGGRHPTTHWLPGEVVADPRRLVLPADAPPGTYRVLVGLYDPVTMERLPVTTAGGEPLADDAIAVGSFEVP